MPEYAVLEAQGPRKWEGNYGVQHDWTLKLQGVEKPAILTLKPETPAPEVGQSMALTLEAHPRFDDKLKAKRENTGGMFGMRPEDPARARRIVRQHSQHMAITLYLGLVAQGLVEAPQSASEAL